MASHPLLGTRSLDRCRLSKKNLAKAALHSQGSMINGLIWIFASSSKHKDQFGKSYPVLTWPPFASPCFTRSGWQSSEASHARRKLTGSFPSPPRPLLLSEPTASSNGTGNDWQMEEGGVKWKGRRDPAGRQDCPQKESELQDPINKLKQERSKWEPSSPLSPSVTCAPHAHSPALPYPP